LRITAERQLAVDCLARTCGRLAPPAAHSSRPVGLLASSAWSCPFPPESDTDKIDQAVATVLVTVGVDGSALSVSVVGDPGHGFGRAAAACALAKRYQPALDRAGAPIVASAPVNVRFMRPPPADER
jgi:periplasmic protein TonB